MIFYGITINDFNTKTIENCVLTDLGSVQTASPRVAEKLEIYGANGTLLLTDGAYESYDRTLSFTVNTLAKVRFLIDRFKSSENKIVFDHDAESIYYADLLSVKHKPLNQNTWKVEFKLQFDPFRYVQSPSVTLSNRGTVMNTGDVFSEPVITVEGNGDVSLTIGNQTMYMTLDTSATIDCRHKKQNVYDKNGSVKNTIRKRGPFFEIKPGRSGVSTTGNVTGITINGNWRFKT